MGAICRRNHAWLAGKLILPNKCFGGASLPPFPRSPKHPTQPSRQTTDRPPPRALDDMAAAGDLLCFRILFMMKGALRRLRRRVVVTAPRPLHWLKKEESRCQGGLR